jgi:hypothetical protein
MLGLGLQLPSVAATLGAGDQFVPTNLDFIDWESRGAEFVAVNGRSAEQIRRDYHGLFETGLLDPFKNGSCLFFAGVTFATCFIPAVARNFDEPVGNAGFAGGNHYPDGLQGTGAARINTNLRILESTQRINHSLFVYVTKLSVLEDILTDIGNILSGNNRIQIIDDNRPGSLFTRYRSQSSGANIPLGRDKGLRMMTRRNSLTLLEGVDKTTSNSYTLTANEGHNLEPIRIFGSSSSGDFSGSRLASAAFGDAHPAPTDLRTALNDLFITKMGITI